MQPGILDSTSTLCSKPNISNVTQIYITQEKSPFGDSLMIRAIRAICLTFQRVAMSTCPPRSSAT